MVINKVQLPIREFGADVYQVLGNAEKSQEWLRNFHDGLVYGIRGKSSFADKLMDEAKAYSESQSDRAKSRWNKYANGSKDGRPCKTQSTTAAGESVSPLECVPKVGSAEMSGGVHRSLPTTTAELYDFVEAARLSEADAREWWELCTERGWKDRYGNPIRDWKKACERYCAKRAINRMAKGETKTNDQDMS